MLGSITQPTWLCIKCSGSRGELSPFAELLHGPGTVLSRMMDIMCMTNIRVVIILLHFTKEEITVTAASPEQG